MLIIAQILITRNRSKTTDNLYPTIAHIARVEYGEQPVVTTAQLAEFYGCDERNIRDNFGNNDDRFIEGKHYFKLEGDTLNSLRTDDIGIQISPMARTLYLWTKRGAARHAKMLSTDRAWEVFEQLKDTYFNCKSVVTDQDKFVSDFERGRELAKLAPHAKDPFAKQCIVAKAANLILGYDFLPIPAGKAQAQLTLWGA